MDGEFSEQAVADFVDAFVKGSLKVHQCSTRLFFFFFLWGHGRKNTAVNRCVRADSRSFLCSWVCVCFFLSTKIIDFVLVLWYVLAAAPSAEIPTADQCRENVRKHRVGHPHSHVLVHLDVEARMYPRAKKRMPLFHRHAVTTTRSHHQTGNRQKLLSQRWCTSVLVPPQVSHISPWRSIPPLPGISMCIEWHVLALTFVFDVVTFASQPVHVEDVPEDAHGGDMDGDDVDESDVVVVSREEKKKTRNGSL